MHRIPVSALRVTLCWPQATTRTSTRRSQGTTLSFDNQALGSAWKIHPHKRHRFPEGLPSVVSVAAAEATAVPRSVCS